MKSAVGWALTQMRKPHSVCGKSDCFYFAQETLYNDWPDIKVKIYWKGCLPDMETMKKKGDNALLCFAGESL